MAAERRGYANIRSTNHQIDRSQNVNRYAPENMYDSIFIHQQIDTMIIGNRSHNSENVFNGKNYGEWWRPRVYASYVRRIGDPRIHCHLE